MTKNKMPKAKGNKDKNLAKDINNMNMDYQPQQGDLPGVPDMDEEKRQEMEETKKELQGLKDKILDKYDFVFAMGILPPKAAQKVEEEEKIPKEVREKKPIHLGVLIPEETF